MNCGELTNENAAHNIVAVDAKAATCTANGNVAYWYCSDCGSAWTDEACTQMTNQRSVVIPATGHEYFYPCDAHCMNCYELTNPDAAHTIVAVEAKAATCTVNGNVAYWYCSDCGSAWTDAACTQMTNQRSVVIPATGHEYFYPCDAHCMNCYELTNPDAAHTVVAVEAKAATCTANGNVAYWYCSDCGSAWTDEACTQMTNQRSVVIPATGHAYMFACDAHCMNCGEFTNENASHTITFVEGYAATCTSMGMADYWTCSDCGAAWLDEALTMVANRMSVIIPVTEHNFVGFSCETDGVCECGEIKLAGHVLTYVAAVEALTCQETGHDEYWFCDGCGAYFGDAEASWQVNPGWIFYTGDCVRPEDAADCAEATCVLCGEVTYGYGDHETGVPACQDGHCSKCDTDVYGYGCANYDTPACMDGECYYCGGFVAGFGHENGAWAPCKDGECSFDCGLKYPATESHVDSDENDFCDNCWTHLVHQVENPCLGGECSICYIYVAPTHEYFYPCDAHCMNCYELTNENASHNVSFVEGYAATCTALGMADYWTCSDCGAAWLDEALTIVANRMSVIIPMAEHEYFYPCDAHCMNCYELTNPDAAHTIVAVDAKAATCTANGNVAYWYCSDCGAAWLDEACTMFANQMSVIVPAPGHADENGDYKCDACSTVVLPEADSALTIPQAIALAKALGVGNYTTNKYYVTATIESVYNTQYGNANVIDADGNKYVFYGMYNYDGSVRYDALTVKPGKGDEVTIYGVVGSYNATTFQVKNGWIDELIVHEHNYVASVLAPTCTADGFTTHTCTICDNNYTDSETPALGHTTENGVCDNCGNTIGSGAPALVEKTGNLSFSSTSNRTVFTTSQQVWKQNGIVLTNDKGSSTSNVADYSNPARFYKSSKITVAMEDGSQITKIVFACNSSSYASALKSSIASNANYTVAVSGSNVTVTFVQPVDSFVIASLTGGQVRVNSMTVTYLGEE